MTKEGEVVRHFTKNNNGIAGLSHNAILDLAGNNEDLLYIATEGGGLDVIDLEDERVLREIALYAERSDITEEITRIESHIAQFRNYFSSEEPVGRPLDFLCQEMTREANTICSKSGDVELTRVGLAMKASIEQFREQVQNVE